MFDGLSNIYSLTAQINALKNAQNNSNLNSVNNANQASQVDPKTYAYEMEKSFSQMLDNLMFSSDEEKEKNNNNDIFSSIIDSQQKELDLISGKNTNPNPNSNVPDLNLP